MSDNPITPDDVELLAGILATAATVANADDGDEFPEPDWLDDRDVAVLLVLNLGRGLVELMRTRDDLGDGLVSGRYKVVIGSTGVELLEVRDPLATGV